MILWDLGLFSGSVVFMTCFNLFDVVSMLYKHVRSYRFHQIPLLCDHQALACTPKDPPRRVDMKEMSFKHIHGTIDWAVDNTVSEHTLVTPIRFAEII